MKVLIKVDESKALIAPGRKEVSFFSPFSPSMILINMQCRNEALMSLGAD